MALGSNKKRKEQIGSLGLGAHTEQYVQRAYDQYAKPYTQEFEKLGEATKKEALAKGLYLSGDYGKALGNNLEDYSRKVAENVVMPMAREGMQMGLQAEQLNLQGRSQTEQERAARVGERFQAAGLTGLYGGGAADIRSLGLNPNDVNNFITRDQMGRATAAEKATWERRVNDAFIAQTGRGLGEGEFNAIMGGGTVATAGTQTLGARAAAEQERAALAGETLATAAQTEVGRANLAQETEASRAAKAREAVAAGSLSEQIRAATSQEAITVADRAERGRQFDANQRQSQQQFLTEMTGRVSGPMVAQNFGVTDEALAMVLKSDGTIDIDAWFPVAEMITSNAETQGVYLTNDMVMEMARGNEVDVTGAPTLDTQRLTDQREQFDASLAQNLTLSDADRAEQSRQFNVDTMRRQIEYTTDVTGKYGAGSVSADLLGIDTESWLVPGEDGGFALDSQGQPQIDYEKRAMAEEDLRGVVEAAGLDLSDYQLRGILDGKAVTVSGMPTMAGRQAAQAEAQALHSRRMDRAAMNLEEDQQELNEAITRAQQSGTYTDPETGKSMNTLEQDRLNLDRQSRMLELTGQVDGKDDDGRFISSLAAVAQTKQLTWEEERRDIENAIARAEQSGSFTDPETSLTSDTLKKQLQNANIRIQDANLDFAREQEHARQRDRFAEITGTYKPGEVSLEVLGIPDDIWNDDGTLDFALRDENGNKIMEPEEYGGGYRIDYKKRSETQATIANNAARMLGRDATIVEVHALMRGESLSLGDPIDTLAKLAQEAGFTGKYDEKDTLAMKQQLLAQEQQDLDEAITRAQQSGSYVDPETEEPLDTLEKRRVELAEAQVTGKYGDSKDPTLDAVIQRAQLTGFFGEGADAKATLAGNRATLDAEIAKRVQALNEQSTAFSQDMEMVREKGFWEIGKSGNVSASDLGIDTTYTASLKNMGDLLGSYEASRLKSVYRELAGEDLSDMEVVNMLQGGGKRLSSPIQIQTLAARSEANREEMERGQLFGTLGGMKTEAARQFDENIADRKNITTADVARINADVSRADKELEAQITQWVSQTNLDIASVTGQFGISGQLTAADLGITVSGDMNYQSVSEQMEKDGPAMSESFKTIYGREPSDSEMSRLFRGLPVAVEATPTLQARQLSQLISSQSMERANDMAKFAEQHDLARDEFDEMSTQYDEEHSRLLDQMADQFTMDRMQFSLARQDLEANHTGKWGYSGQITAQDIGFSTEVYANLPVGDPKKREYANSLMETYKSVQGEDLPGGLTKAYQLLAGTATLEVDSAWTQTAKDSARKFGLDERQFLQANEQFQSTFDESNRQAWMQIKGYEEGADGTKEMTQGYRAWEKAQAALDKVDRRRDASWEAITQRNLGRYSGDRQNPYDPAGTGPRFEPADWMMKTFGTPADMGRLVRESDSVGEGNLKIANQLSDHFEKAYGYPPERKAVMGMIERYQKGENVGIIRITGWKDSNDVKELANVMNGHALEISQAMSGWESAGQIFGNVLSAGATAYASSGSDPRLKENISHIGYSSSGLKVYEFDYKPGLGPVGRYSGVMSNEIPQGAVIHRAILGKYDAVNYDRVDVDFKRLR